MRPLVLVTVFLVAILVAGKAQLAYSQTADIPHPPREFRAVWVATVANIDWPSRPGLPADKQKSEMLAILDKCQDMNLNAVVFQVRPAGDALYDSKLEPWSEYLTGKQGQAPEPYYDPLKFVVDEAHKRGLELHVWFNPYRARHASAKSPVAPTHLSVTRPELVKKFGDYLWMDPGEQGVQDHSMAVILDVVKRYDVDGIHLDDYFYPYPSYSTGTDFPDQPSWDRYKASGGKLERNDWRRDNVNRFIKRIYEEVKAERPEVKFGISPFGIYRPGHPPSVKSGFDQYATLYADALKWLEEGWLDYWTPQVYWPIDSPQPYGEILKYWAQKNTHKRHFWPGNFTGKVGDPEGGPWQANEIVKQIQVTRATPGATGNVHFSMRVFMQNRQNLADLLKDKCYSVQALVPATTWVDSTPPPTPTLTAAGKTSLSWSCKEKPWLWVLYTKTGGVWSYKVLPGEQTMLRVPADHPAPSEAAVSAVDRNGNESSLAYRRL